MTRRSKTEKSATKRATKTRTVESAPKNPKKTRGLKPNARRAPFRREEEPEKLEVGAYFKAISPVAINNVPAKTWARFLEVLAETGHVARSCKAVGLNRITAYARRAADEEFRKAWEEAHAIGLSVLEDEAKRRAFEGVEEPVFYQGDICGYKTQYSDNLLMFLLQGNNSKYKRKQEITGANGGPLAVLAQLDDEGLDEVIKQRLRELQETPES